MDGGSINERPLMHADEPIVMTGLALACSLGLDPEQTFDAVLAGRCGLGTMPALEQLPAPDKGGGQALPLQSESQQPAAPVSREAHYLRHVVSHALRSAGLHPYPPARVAVVLGTTLHGMRAVGRWARGGGLSELAAFPAGAVLRSALAGSEIGGVRLSTCSACSSALSAVALAATLLHAGEADMVIAGGYDTVSEYAYAGFDSLRLVAAGPPRPFGAQREGMKTAEGYGLVVLERESHAAARTARLRGYLAGVGESADAHHLTQPHPEGLGARAAILQALANAGLAPDAIGLISAHATATPGNDASEYAALRGALGERLGKIPVVAFKGHLGHTLGGAGAVELVLSILARERGLVPPTLNSLPLDPAFTDLHLNHDHPRPTPIRATLNLSLGFGGANTCVVVSTARPDRQTCRGDDAVITGVGIVLPGAIGNSAFVNLFDEAIEGSSAGRATIPAGPVAEESIAHLINSRRVRRMSDYVKLTLAATSVACEHAGLSDAAAFAVDASVLLGTMHGSSNFCEQYYTQIVRDGLASANPALFAEGVPNAGAAQLSLMLGVRGGCQTLVGARTSGLDALRLAAMRIRQGLWSRVFVGAGEEYSPTVNLATAACCDAEGAPFAAGAVTLIVESRAAAAARGARVLASVDSGWSTVGGVQPALRAVERNPADLVMSSLTASRADSLIFRGLDGLLRDRHRSIHAALPECFSVGGLAAIAAALLSPEILSPRTPHGGRVMALSTDSGGEATGVLLRI